jgi:hypothetical protein
MNQHNLDINNYSLPELFELFELTYHINIEDLKRAKKKVLMIHPDKSKLPSEYFLFYKRAFEMIVQFYEEQYKQNQSIPTTPIQYNTMNTSDTISKKQLSQVIEKMDEHSFQQKFNELFEKNMVKKNDNQKNEWFKNNEPVFHTDTNVSVDNMGQIFENIKQKNTGLIKYKGVETLTYGNSGCNLYDDDETNTNDTYVSCDPFSKLKYEDLRKVHKDQTVFSVSENDFQKVKQYNSVDHLVRERGIQNCNPLDTKESEYILETQQREHEQLIMKKQYQSKLQSMEYEQKNKQVLANFMRIDNGIIKNGYI